MAAPRTSVLVLSVLALLLACTYSAHALTTTVLAGEVLELSEVAPAETVVTFQFQVANDDGDIKAYIKDGDGKMLHDFGTAREGLFAVEARDVPKRMVVYFDNSGSRFYQKSVNFYFRQTINQNYVATGTQLDPIETKVRALLDTVESMKAVQVMLRTEQKEHRATVEDANERVLVWTVFQVAALIVMSTFQLYFLKRFLEKKSFV